MDVDEAKSLFSLMGWAWTPLPLSRGNLVRGRLPPPWQGGYEVFTNEVMVEVISSAGRARSILEPCYEAYDLDRCLTRYAEIYLGWIAAGRPNESQ